MTADWWQDALCAQVDTTIFFPDKGGSTKEAKLVCSRCPVTAECLAEALKVGEQFGVRGGLSKGERRKLERGDDVVVPLPRRGRPIPAELELQVRALLDESTPVRAIARTVGVSEKTVRRVRDRRAAA